MAETTLRERLSFLNTEQGLEYCGDDEEFYMDILHSYLEENVLAVLNDLYLKSEWPAYRVRVHALKTSSRYIGADDISEKAKALEFAARDNNISYINMNHYRFMWQYEMLLKKINSIFINSNYQEDVAQLGQIRVMIIDDNPSTRSSISGILSKFFDVTECTSGEEALDLLKTFIPDVILLDVFMPPGIDGYQVLQELKNDEKLSTVPVIMMTANAQEDTEFRGLTEGAADFINKHANSDVLIARINRIVELEYLRKSFQVEIKKQTSAEQERRLRAERFSEEIVLALANTIDAKDKFTKGHSDRVAAYSLMIAKELGYTEEQLRNLRYAAILHDIGKIGVPDEIINKPEKLTDEEYEKVKAHTTIGANILSNITSIEDMAVAAKYHHERYDGNGYPEGLSGLHIPEVARIIGVADAYDAMTSHRGYRPADLSQEKVRNEILNGLGTQFDPLYGQTMLDLIDKDTEFTMRED